MFKSLLCQEHLFVLLILSGYVKGILLFLGVIQFDLTLLIALLSVFAIATGLFTNRLVIYPETLNLLAVFILFWLVLLASMITTPSNDYARDKIVYFGVTTLCFLVPIFTINFNWERFTKILVYYALALCLLFVAIYPLIGSNSELADFRSYYLKIGLLAGLCFFISLSNANYSIAALFLVILVLTGARGPIILTLLIAFLFSFNRVLRLCKRFFRPSYLIVAMTGVLVLSLTDADLSGLGNMLERSVNRTMLLYTASPEEVATNRVEHSLLALEQIQNRPVLGFGLGSFGVITQGVDERLYPHNSILEIWFEMGVFGVFIFIFLLFYAFLQMIKYDSVALILPTLYLFANSLKSSSIVENKLLFGLLAASFIFALSSRNRRAAQ